MLDFVIPSADWNRRNVKVSCVQGCGRSTGEHSDPDSGVDRGQANDLMNTVCTLRGMWVRHTIVWQGRWCFRYKWYTGLGDMSVLVYKEQLWQSSVQFSSDGWTDVIQHSDLSAEPNDHQCIVSFLAAPGLGQSTYRHDNNIYRGQSWGGCHQWEPNICSISHE